jgi:hypothetical protein
MNSEFRTGKSLFGSHSQTWKQPIFDAFQGKLFFRVSPCTASFPAETVPYLTRLFSVCRRRPVSLGLLAVFRSVHKSQNMDFSKETLRLFDWRKLFGWQLPPQPVLVYVRNRR